MIILILVSRTDEILEYCEVSELLKREKYYIDSLQSEYNIIKDPTLPPMSNRTHSDETRKIMSDAKKGHKHPMFGQNHSDETLNKISEANKGENLPNFGKTLSEETRKKISDTSKKIENSGRFKTGQQRAEGAGKPYQSIEVLDLKENTTTIYDSISAAARALDIPGHRSIQYSLTTGKAYKKRYTFVRR
jgi:group I intron endonuclease